MRNYAQLSFNECCTWTVGTSVKALMKSSSSTAPAPSFDTEGNREESFNLGSDPSKINQ